MDANAIEACFIGRLGKDPEVKTSKAGKPYAKFSVAVGDKEDTQWVNVTVFGDMAEKTAAQLHKGDRAYCEGRIKLDAWTDQQGQQRSGLSLAAWKVHAIGQIGERRPKKEQEEAGYDAR